MNVIRGIEEATKIGAKTVGFLGKGGGALKDMVDYPMVVPSDNTQRIQEAHITIGHILCTLVETPEGNLAIVLLNGMPGWLYYFVVVF